MTESEAVHLVERRRKKLDIDPQMEFESAERVILEYKRNPQKPGRTEDRLAWVLLFSSPWGFVTVSLDERSGKVLKVVRSR